MHWTAERIMRRSTHICTTVFGTTVEQGFSVRECILHVEDLRERITTQINTCTQSVRESRVFTRTRQNTETNL